MLPLYLLPSRDIVSYAVRQLGYEVDGSVFEFQYKQEMFSLLQDVQTGSGLHQTSYSMDTTVISRAYSGRGAKLATHHPLAPRLRVSGGEPLLHLYGFMVWTRASATGNAGHWHNPYIYTRTLSLLT